MIYQHSSFLCFLNPKYEINYISTEKNYTENCNQYFANFSLSNFACTMPYSNLDLSKYTLKHICIKLFFCMQNISLFITRVLFLIISLKMPLENKLFFSIQLLQKMNIKWNKIPQRILKNIKEMAIYNFYII